MLNKVFKRKRRTLILGIHGLSNKPPAHQLKRWWQSAIKEGLRDIKDSPTTFDFKMIYWADILYKIPLNSKEKDPNHPLFIEDPYLSRDKIKRTQPVTFWQRVKHSGQYVKEVIFLSKIGLNNFRKPFNFIVKTGFRDLDIYFNEEIPMDQQMASKPVKAQIRSRMIDFLLKNKDKNILILAHSMGSIIAYDVLHMLGNKIDGVTFVSMGSPLGLPLIRENIMKDHNLPFEEEAFPPTPECVDAWYDFLDDEDNLAVFYNLGEYYQPNSKGVKPIETHVNNDYKHWVTENAHKSFGYLRTAELAQVVCDFLQAGRSSFLTKGKQFFRKKGREQS